MGTVIYRQMTARELPRLADIDRSETVHVAYELKDGALVSKVVDWRIPDFIREGDGDHTLAHQVAFCRRHLDAGALMIGAFADETLVGIGLVTPEIRPGLAQLAYLHVSAAHRRQGIASGIVARLFDLARRLGAERVYVSATETQSAVGFYRHLGFCPVADPLSELFREEPEDIHMVVRIADARLTCEARGAMERAAGSFAHGETSAAPRPGDARRP